MSTEQKYAGLAKIQFVVWNNAPLAGLMALLEPSISKISKQVTHFEAGLPNIYLHNIIKGAKHLTVLFVRK